jgi:hypothetical protein
LLDAEAGDGDSEKLRLEVLNRLQGPRVPDGQPGAYCLTGGHGTRAIRGEVYARYTLVAEDCMAFADRYTPRAIAADDR